VLESIGDGFLAIDREWRLTYANRKAQLLAGATGEALIGKVLWDALPRLAAPAQRALYEEAMSGSGPARFEIDYTPGEQWFEVRAYPSESGLALYFSDVSERTQADELLRRFIANAAHELRSPLGILVATASLLGERGDTIPPWRFERAMEIIARQGERAQVLISDLLDLSKFEHATPVELEPVRLRAAVRDAIEAAPAPAGRSVVVDIGDEVCVLADRPRLERILINLLTNAYRYGGDTISLTAQVTGTEVDVAVADNGPGVSPDLVPHLFEPFCRARAGGMEGSGLGLAIVRALVGGMGGAVWYEAGTEGGAQFTFRLAAG
jgi:PAS domain S-box-containing protein